MLQEPWIYADPISDGMRNGVNYMYLKICPGNNIGSIWRIYTPDVRTRNPFNLLYQKYENTMTFFIVNQ